MTLLIQGLELLRRYELALQRSETLVGSDVRLAAYAIEAVVLHREECLSAEGHEPSWISRDLKQALVELRDVAIEFETSRVDGTSLKLGLLILNNNLSTYITQKNQLKMPATNQSFEILNVSKSILRKLRSECGLQSA